MIEPGYLTVGIAIIGAAVSAGVAWGGARAGASSMKHELTDFRAESRRSRLELRDMIKEHIREDDEDRQQRALLEVSRERRISRLETIVGKL